MIIAIPTLDGQVSHHFGKTRDFTLFTVEDGKVISTRQIQNLIHSHDLLGDLLKENGVELVLCGGMGQGAQNKLTAEGIAFIGGCEGPIEAVVQRYLDGQLQFAPLPSCGCSGHHEGDGHHHDSCQGEMGGCQGGCQH